MTDKCQYCELNDEVEGLIVAHACRSCCRFYWKMVLASHGRGTVAE